MMPLVLMTAPAGAAHQAVRSARHKDWNQCGVGDGEMRLRSDHEIGLRRQGQGVARICWPWQDQTVEMVQLARPPSCEPSSKKLNWALVALAGKLLL